MFYQIWGISSHYFFEYSLSVPLSFTSPPTSPAAANVVSCYCLLGSRDSVLSLFSLFFKLVNSLDLFSTSLILSSVISTTEPIQSIFYFAFNDFQFYNFHSLRGGVEARPFFNRPCLLKASQAGMGNWECAA